MLEPSQIPSGPERRKPILASSLVGPLQKRILAIWRFLHTHVGSLPQPHLALKGISPSWYPNWLGPTQTPSRPYGVFYTTMLEPSQILSGPEGDKSVVLSNLVGPHPNPIQAIWRFLHAHVGTFPKRLGAHQGQRPFSRALPWDLSKPLLGWWRSQQPTKGKGFEEPKKKNVFHIFKLAARWGFFKIPWGPASQ